MGLKKWNWWFFGIGGAVVLLGIALGIAWPKIFETVVNSQLKLTKNSLMFRQWNHSALPIHTDIFMWNLTNAKEFEKNYSVVPEYEEIGPFVFEITTERVNVVWNDNGSVTFSPKRTWKFVPEESKDLNLLITNINPIPVVISYYARKWTSEFFILLVNNELNIREKLLTTATVNEWLFKGIPDELFSLIVPFRNITDLPIPFDHFAWFAGRNGSTTVEGVFTIDTGVEDIYNLGNIRLWNGESNSGIYEGKCGNVGGSTGEVFHRQKADEIEENVQFFVADVCSQLNLSYVGETSVAGVDGRLYMGTDRMFDNGTLYPEMSCFCSGECLPSGVRNVSTCKFNAPAFVSMPHFLQADHYYTDKISGMSPDPSKHNFSFVVEPTLGIPMYVRASVQINLMTWPSEQFDMYKTIPRLFMPCFWLRERATLTEDLAHTFKLVLFLKILMLYVFYGVGLIGLLICMARIVWIIYHKPRNYF